MNLKRYTTPRPTYSRQGKVHNAYELLHRSHHKIPRKRICYADAYVGIAEIHLEAKDYVNARANYEEAIYSTADAEEKKELYAAYHRTYLIPVYPDPDRTKRADPSDELFVKARLLRKEKRFLEAAKIYEQLANSNLSTEDKVYALYWAGRCYHEASRTDSTLFSKSADIFNMLIRDYGDSPDTIKAYYHLASVYTDWAQKSGDRSKCQLVIDTVEKANTKYVGSDDHRYRGWLNRMQELKEKALQKSPQPPDPLKEKAKKAIKYAETSIAHAKQENIEPQLIRQANEHLEDAKQQMSRGDYKTALRLAEKALDDLNPPSPPPKKKYVDQGYIYLRQGILEEATKEARQALNLDSNCRTAQELLSEIKETHYSRGWTFFDEEQYNTAIAEFKSAIGIDLNFKEAHCHLGVIYIEQQRYTEAIKALKKAINIDEEFKEAHFNIALAYLELGDFEAAINHANAALRIDPNYEPARMLIEFIAD